VRPGAVALVSLVAAVLGAAGVLVVAHAAGWLGRKGTTKTVVVREPVGDTGNAAPVVIAKPLVGNGFQPAQIYRARASGAVTVFSFFGDTSSTTSAGQGSGFVVSRNGVILTNSHVITTAGETQEGRVSPAKEVYVEFQDGGRVPARIVGYDLFDDVGVLRVDPKAHPLAPVPLGESSRVVVGQPVAAIGSPFGNESSLTVGVVSATHREIESITSKFDLIDAIQTDAPINHGNSGGPLFDARGRVIGINAQIRSNAGSGFEGVGFAVPINAAKRSMKQLLTTGKVSYAYLGISSEDLTPDVAAKYGYGVRRGALVAKVNPDTAAQRAGLRGGVKTVVVNGEETTIGGDAIVAIDRERVRNAADVVRIVGEQLVPGQVAKFTIVRGKRRLVIPVRLAERSP
jgi:S1-C subfamily serine protease